jgi:uncharacterized protein YcbK (DUF882 family)
MKGQKHLLNLIYKRYSEEYPLSGLLHHFQREYSTYGSQVHPLLWMMLDAMREEAGHPIFITSHFRRTSTTTHGGTMSGTPPAIGVDIRCWHSRPRMALHDAARAVGFSRIGHYCDDGHIHVDIGNLVDPEKWPEEVFFLPKPRGSNDGG